VNARLVSERNKVPYLASTVLPEGVDEKILDDFHDPTPGDVEKYGHLANILANKLNEVIEILDDSSPPPATIYSSRVQKKLTTPTPTPIPAISNPYHNISASYSAAPPYSIPAPPYSIPTPTYAAPAYSAPPPNISYPPIGYPQQAYPGANPSPPVGAYVNTYIPPPISSLINPILLSQPPKPLSLWTEVPSDKPAPVPASKLAQEFFVEKQIALAASPAVDQIQEQLRLASEYKNQEERKLLLAQEEAQRKLLEEKKRSINETLKCRWTSSNNGSGRTSREKTPVLDEEQSSDVEVIDRAIANLDNEIQKKRDGKSSNVELDRFGYVVRTTNTESQPSNNGSNPADLYKSIFGGDANTTGRRKRRTGSKSRSPAKRRRSRSRVRKSRSRSRGRLSRNTRSRSKSKGQRRRRSRSPVRRTARYSISPVRSRARSRVSRSPRRRSRTPISNLRQSRSRSTSKGKMRMDTEPRRKGKEYSGPPVPAFMLHPADRLFSGDVEKGSSVRKRMHQRKEKGYDDVDNGMAALDVTLNLIREMKVDGNETASEVNLISMEVEILDDGNYKQFTQIGVSTEDKETGVFNRSLFRSILPTYMDHYDKNLILKNQNNLHSSLKLKFDEVQKEYSFQHVKKGDDKPVTEEKALQDVIAFMKRSKSETDVVVFTLSKGTILPLLLARLRFYKLEEEFSTLVKGFCDFNSCTTNLKLNGIWKETKFGDLIDVYKQIMGKPWPKEPRHCDGISILSGSVLKKMIKDYTEYLYDLSFKFSINKFLKVCGLRSVDEMFNSFKEEIHDINCRTDLDKNDVKELELRPSDRPGEITIITLKRFECIEVLDMDEVEEEGINEDDYFVTEGNKAYVTSKSVIKPGFVVSVPMKLQGSTDLTKNDEQTITSKKGSWSLVSKNIEFGENKDKDEANEEGECEENLKRIKVTCKCEISRQIVQISRTLKPVKDDMSMCEEVNVILVKVLNPLDVDLVLDVGDEIAVVKLEKEVDENDPETKTYSRIKLEAEMKHAIEEDNREREFEEEKEIARTKKKRKNKKRKKKPRLDTIDNSKTFDHDALDFEPIDSGEDIESSEDEMDFEDPSDKNIEKDSSHVAEKNDKEARQDRHRSGHTIQREKSGRSSKERNGNKSSTSRENQSRSSKESTRKERKDKVSDGRSKEKDAEKSNDGKAEEPKIMDPEFYNRRFFLHTMKEFTEIRAGKTVKVPMVVMADYGYLSRDLVGRKCKITINTDFIKFKFNNYNLFEKETTIELRKEYKSNVISPMVDVEIQNFTTSINHYPKGVKLGVCKFIDENEPSEPSAKENDSKFYNHWFKCYPPSLCSVLGMTTATVPMILQEEQGFTIDDMVNQKCRVKKNGSLKSQIQMLYDREVLSSCVIKEKETTVIRYTDPMTVSKKTYPAVLVELKNITVGKKVYKRDLPLALCKFIRPHDIHFAPDDADTLDTILPDPVPVRSEPLPPGEEESNQSPENESHYSQGPVIYNSLSLGLPEPVPGNKRLLNIIEVTRELPSEQELRGWSVKKLKSCLGDAGLHQYGLKNDLVKRLFEFYKKNPSKCPVNPQTSKEIAEELLNDVLNGVLGIKAVSNQIKLDLPFPISGSIKIVEEGSRIPVISKSNPCTDFPQISECDDGLGGKVCIMASDGIYRAKNGQQIPILGGSNVTSFGSMSPAASSGTASPFGSEGSLTIPVLGSSVGNSRSSREAEKQKIIDVDKENTLKKIGEIKSFEKLGLEFFKTGMSIRCTEDFIVGRRERKVLTFKMAELDLFSSELSGRRILIKERDNDKRIITVFKQTANIIVNERKSEVDVLVQNDKDKEVIVKANDKVKLIRVYVEKLEKDFDHQFDIPEDDDIIDDVENFLETDAVDASTTTDIVLKPKTYHTEVCTVKTSKSYKEQPFVVFERTKASGMKIGMRKMILVPKVLSFLNTEGEEATLLVTLYNASKQTLRITKKTKIASVRIQKQETLMDEEYDLEVDQRRKFGEVNVIDRSIVKEGRPVLLTFNVNGARKPSLVKIVVRSGKSFVPLGPELAGEREEFKVKFLETPSDS